MTGYVPGICCPLLPRRYVVCFLCFLALSMTYLLRICMSQLITDMGDDQVRHTKVDSTTKVTLIKDYYAFNDTEYYKPAGETDWDTETKDIILSAFFWSYPLSHLTGGLLAERVSARLTLTCSLLVSSVCALITPVVVWRLGARGLVALQVVTGLGQGFIYPSLNVLLSRWAPVEERASLSTFVYSGEIFGTIMSLSYTNYVLHSVEDKWQSVFYVFGLLGLSIVVLWTLVGYNKPDAYPGISMKERLYLQHCPLPLSNMQELPHTPWKKMLTSMPLWALIIAKAGTDWAQYTVINRLPRYTRDVLHCPFDGSNLPLWPALPYVVLMVVSLITSVIADTVIYRKVTKLTFCRMFFLTVGAVGAALSLIVAVQTGCDDDAVFFIIGMGLYGFFYPSLQVNALDLSPNYAGTVMALVNGIASLTDVVRPYVIDFYASNATLHHDVSVFYITAGVFVVSCIVFLVMGSAEVQSWNNPAPPSGPQPNLRPRLSNVSSVSSRF